MIDSKNYTSYLNILKEELIPALGCTEPIAIALAAAKARETLGSFPEKIEVACSGNVIKNAMGVTIPGTKNLKGVNASVVLGAIAGNSKKGLEVLDSITQKDIDLAKGYIDDKICKVKVLETNEQLNIVVKMWRLEESALVEIKGTHTNIVRVEKNGSVLFLDDGAKSAQITSSQPELTFEEILEFVKNVKILDLEAILRKQIECNSAIAMEGLENDYAANIGKTLIEAYGGSDIKLYAKAFTAAGSDARMGGCALPVVINSGSGNQGMTASLPVIAYAKHMEVDSEKLLRSLALSNLISILIKREIGRLSAYCGVVSAACGSGAAITYLCGGSDQKIANTVTNTLANTSGMLCDGAKASCAAKIVSALDSAILGHEMSMKGTVFSSGEGIVKENITNTIKAIGTIARDGMKKTDEEILKVMIH